jgi:GMP synthase (glutamine-hydrolysing)
VRAAGGIALLEGIEDRRNAEGHGLLDVWMSHGDKVAELPPGFTLIGSSDACGIAAMADPSRGFYAVQFHPEVTHTKQGAAILSRFAHEICGCGEDWNMRDYEGEAVAAIRAQVGSDSVLLGLSGGVDSSVAAALIHEAIGDQLTCVFVDHGLLRLNEAKQVMDTFARNLGVRVIHVNCADEMYAALDGIDDPEQKRRIIGRVFVDVFQREAEKLRAHGAAPRWLAQGTIYPDVIESVGAKTKKAHTIKSHHNVGGLPETLHLKLLEPLRELFKDEVRSLVGAPAARMVFVTRSRAGSACASSVRSRRRTPICCVADAIFIDELRLARDGDGSGTTRLRRRSRSSCPCARWRDGGWRTYRHAVALRAVRRPIRLRTGRTCRSAPRQRYRPDHQRGPRDQSRRLRHLGQTARDNRWE